MASRNRYTVLKGIRPEQAREVLGRAVNLLPGPPPNRSKWTDSVDVVRPQQLVALIGSDALVLLGEAWRLAEQVKSFMDVKHLELRIQESDHWDFTLYHRRQIIVDFSTRVSYYDADPARLRPWKQGDAAAFARVWGVPLQRVLPYLIDWDTLDAPRLAVEEDRYPAGDCWQIADFMRAIGVEEPSGHPEAFPVEVHAWDTMYKRQPGWRRAIRQLSVWLKGTYPDVPRPSRAEREHRERLQSAVTAVRIDWAGSDDDSTRDA